MMKVAEGDGRIAAARDVVRRYRRAKAYPEVTDARIEAHRAYLREIFAEWRALATKRKRLENDKDIARQLVLGSPVSRSPVCAILALTKTLPRGKT